MYIYILTSQYFCYRISQNQAFLQSGSVLELDMHESKQILPGQFVDSVGFCELITLRSTYTRF